PRNEGRLSSSCDGDSMSFAFLLTISNVPSKGFVINPIDSPPPPHTMSSSMLCFDLKGGSCRAIPGKPEEMVNGILMVYDESNDDCASLGEDKTVMINLRQESKKPISLENLFELVADDLQSMNENLLSIVGAENPVLISAAEQIFCAGGKKMRALVFMLTTSLQGMTRFAMHRSIQLHLQSATENVRGSCIIEKENNFEEPGDRYRSFTPERQERFIGRWIDALSDPPITHEIRNIWISYWSQANKSLGQKLASRLNVRPGI
ncbi:hypothetical protein HID58_075752, partial [Brassica napus]